MSASNTYLFHKGDNMKNKRHYKRADALLTLVFVYGYDVDWYPLLVKSIGNW